MERYIGRYVVRLGAARKIVGYAAGPGGLRLLIIDASQIGGWTRLGTYDVVFKECKMYLYVSIDNPIY